VLDDDSFRRLQVLLERTAGLVFDDARRDSLDYSIRERMRATGSVSAADYLRGLAEPVERQQLLDEVTIQETHFFRYPPQMLALQRRVLPELISHGERTGRRLRVWSAGCSTGEEAYSVAMLLRELLPGGWDVRVLATDLSQAALSTARVATYGRRSLQQVSPQRLDRFFLPAPDGRHRLRPEVTELVDFRQHNLVLDEPPGDRQDLVLCRNVTIYFSRETTRRLMGRLHDSLRDGGYLLLGHSETLWRLSESFTLVPVGAGDDAAYVYRRGPAAAPPSPRVPAGPPAPSTVPPARTNARPTAVRRSPHPLGRPRTGPRATADAPPVQDPAPEIRQALAQGRYADAARLARTSAAVEPLRSELHYLLGRALTDSGLDDQALPALRRAVYLDPSAGLAHFLLAGALARSGDAAAAAREYRAAAHALHRSPQLTGAPELGGRSPRELAGLCEQLDRRHSTGVGG
jgi:chemotaxis protein methyltransferase CheR